MVARAEPARAREEVRNVADCVITAAQGASTKFPWRAAADVSHAWSNELQELLENAHGVPE